MKRTLALTLLGVAAATTAFAQGDFQFSNYQIGGPYVPISFGGTPVPNSIQVTVWGAAGNVAAGALTQLGVANWSTFAGYTDNQQVFRIPAADYVGGAEWTLQLRAQGTIGGQPVIGAGPLVVTANIGNQEVFPPDTPKFNYSPGFALVVVPEPSTFALAGLGAAALLIFRRRA